MHTAPSRWWEVIDDGSDFWGYVFYLWLIIWSGLYFVVFIASAVDFGDNFGCVIRSQEF